MTDGFRNVGRFGAIVNNRWAVRRVRLEVLLGQQAVAVEYDLIMPMAAAVVDSRIVGEPAAEETVREHEVVLQTATHPPHVVAVGDRGGAQVARPAVIGRCR